MKAKVSVIIPVYDRASRIGRSLLSILGAGYDNVEVLVIDDGSRDGTLQVIRGLEAGQPAKVRVLMHQRHENRGVSASRNLGIGAATGDYICFLDSDDVVLPGRFDYAARILDSYPNVDGVYEAAEVCSEDNERIALLAVGEEIPFMRLGECDCEPRFVIHTGGILVRRALLEKCGPFDERKWVGEDIHMWLRMLMVGRLVPGRSQQPVVRYYKHSGNTSGFDVADIELRVTAEVHAWARRRGVSTDRLTYLRTTHMNLLYYYLSQARLQRDGIRKELRLLGRTLMSFPSSFFTRQYLANLYRTMDRRAPTPSTAMEASPRGY